MNIQELEVSPEVVKKEFNLSTERFHVIAIWVGIGLNLVWFVNDIFVFPKNAFSFLMFRLSVCIVSALLVLLRKQLKIDIYFCLFVLVTGISIQNAYMWSFMDVKHLQQHSAAYMVLFIGAGMLVLWELRFSILMVIATILSNIIFYKLNSILTVDEFIINGGLLVFTVSIFSIFLIRTRFRMTNNEIRSRLILAKSKEIIERENKVILQQSKEITDSITYAKRIQQAVLSSEENFEKTFKEAFLFFRPKDIVSGDFYWKAEVENKIYFAVADCTGHGVPGGFMTILNTSILERVVMSKKDILPNEILDKTREILLNSLSQGSDNEQSKDGMDIILGCFDKETNDLHYASAFNPVLLVRNGVLEKMEADKQPVGYFDGAKPFSSFKVKVEKNDTFYFTSDGFQDQFGGPNLKKFRSKMLHDELLKNSHLSFLEQKTLLKTVFENWKAENEQTDDVLVVGIQFI